MVLPILPFTYKRREKACRDDTGLALVIGSYFPYILKRLARLLALFRL
jgi:hypothetical protein